MIRFENFIADFEELNKHARSLSYGGVTNPQDGVLYPDVSADVPVATVAEIKYKLEHVLAFTVNINMAFFRLTNKNTSTAPHQAHNDTIMGDFTFLLYMQNGAGGTSFVCHKAAGMKHGPVSDVELSAWKRDTNIPDAWEVNGIVGMQENRACVFDSSLMHRAEPVHGFGDSVDNGRLVLTAFVSRL